MEHAIWNGTRGGTQGVGYLSCYLIDDIVSVGGQVPDVTMEIGS